MEKFYTQSESILINGAKVLERLNAALKLDLMLLELESSVGLMDGLPLPGAEEGGANG